MTLLVPLRAAAFWGAKGPTAGRATREPEQRKQ